MEINAIYVPYFDEYLQNQRCLMYTLLWTVVTKLIDPINNIFEYKLYIVTKAAVCVRLG